MNSGTMRHFVTMRSFVAGACVAAAASLLALPARAQIDQPAPPEPPAKAEQLIKPHLAPETPASPASVDAFIAKLDNASRAIHENSKKDPELMREGCRALL